MFPVWIINSESHFSVLFGLQRQLPRDRFELVYYDELAEMDCAVRLTIGMLSRMPLACHAQLTPTCADTTRAAREERHASTIEQTVRTKWHKAAIDWNGAERIL